MRTRMAALALGAMAVLIVGAIPVPRPKRSAGRRDANRAARTALAATRGGEAVKVGRELESSATWEVEVLGPDHHRVDVLLDDRFRVLDVSDELDPNETLADRNRSGVADSNKPSRGHQAHLAAQAAAKAVGGGMLIDIDRDSDKGAPWEVEFMKLDGERVSVLLDHRLRTISVRHGKQAN